MSKADALHSIAIARDAAQEVITNLDAAAALVDELQDAPPSAASISIDDVIVDENDGVAKMTVTISRVLAVPVNFKVSTRAKTALPGSDYQEVIGAAYSIPPGQTSIMVPITVINDDVPEGTEAFEVYLHDVDPVAIIDDGVGLVTILDTDTPPPNNGGPIPLAKTPVEYFASRGSQLYIRPRYDQTSRSVKTVVSYAEYSPTKTFSGLMVRYLLDGAAVSDVVDASLSIPLNIPDGVHVIEVEVVDGTMDLAILRAEPEVVAISEDGTQQFIPAIGQAHHTIRHCGAVDHIPNYVASTRPSRAIVPHSDIFIPPVRDRVGEDPVSYRSVYKWWRDPIQYGCSNLYHSNPYLVRNKAGVVYQKPLHYQSGDNATDATPLVRKHVQYDGPRGRNAITPYTTFSPLFSSKDKIVGITLDGRIFYLYKTGDVETFAGRKRKDNEAIALDPDDPTATAKDYDDQHVWVGGFADGVEGLDAPHDIIELRKRPGVFVIADSFKHRILVLDTNQPTLTFVTVAGVAGQLGDTEGPATQALLDKPYSVDELDNGDLVMCCTARDDGANSAVKLLTGDWINRNGTIRNLVGRGLKGADSGVWRPFVGKLDSLERLVVVEYDTGLLKRVDISTGQVTVLARNVTRARWYWLAVDRWGSVGPVNDILVTVSTGHNNTSVQRYDGDGNFLNIWEGFSGTTGNYLASGQAGECFQNSDHYPWAVCLSPHEARMWFYGFGGIGVRQVHARIAADISLKSDYPVFGEYRSMMYNGSLPGMPYGCRPSFTALRSLYGHTMLDLPTYDELVSGMSPDDLKSYIRDGFGGTTPRPEFFGYWADVMYYGAAISAYPGPQVAAPKRPRNPDGTAIAPPALTGLTIRQQPDGRWVVSFSTSTPAATAITFGKAPAKYHRAAFVGVGTYHQVYLRDKPEHFVIDAWDGAGNRVQTLDQVA